jgi:hypothetical protein
MLRDDHVTQVDPYPELSSRGQGNGCVALSNAPLNVRTHCFRHAREVDNKTAASVLHNLTAALPYLRINISGDALSAFRGSSRDAGNNYS